MFPKVRECAWLQASHVLIVASRAVQGTGLQISSVQESTATKSRNAIEFSIGRGGKINDWKAFNKRRRRSSIVLWSLGRRDRRNAGLFQRQLRAIYDECTSCCWIDGSLRRIPMLGLWHLDSFKGLSAIDSRWSHRKGSQSNSQHLPSEWLLPRRRCSGFALLSRSNRF